MDIFHEKMRLSIGILQSIMFCNDDTKLPLMHPTTHIIHVSIQLNIC